MSSYSVTKDMCGGSTPHSRAYTSNCKENLQLSLQTNKIFCGTDENRRNRRTVVIAEVVRRFLLYLFLELQSYINEWNDKLALVSFKDLKVTAVAMTLSSHNFPADRAWKLSKPSKEAESLLRSTKKDPGSFRFEICLGDVMSRVGLSG